MLNVEQLHFKVQSKEILKNINAMFLPGEFNVILGPNGSGKSTFLKIFSGEVKQNKGSVSYNNISIANTKKEELAKVRAVMSQQPELSFPLTVEEVVMMGRYPHFIFKPTRKDEKICNEVMDRMNVSILKERNYLTLSGGEKQRVQFTRVLAQIWEKPEEGYRYLFLDEPLTSLDIKYQLEFLQIAREFVKDNTVLIAVMHDINLALQYADKLFFLKDGKLVANGSPGDILSEALIEEVFSVKSTIITHPVSAYPIVVF